MRRLRLLAVAALIAGNAAAANRDAIYTFLRGALPFMENYSLGHLRAMKPKKETRAASGNGITLIYDGLEVKGTVKEHGVIPASITVTTAKWDLGSGFRVGMPFGKVRDTLGEPTSRKGKTDVYCQEGNCLSFTNEAGKLSRFRYEYLGEEPAGS